MVDFSLAMKKRYDLLVIGNGIAGNSAIEGFRRYNREASIALVTNDSEPLYSPCILPLYLSDEIKKKDLFLKGIEDYKRFGIEFLSNTKVYALDPKNKLIYLEGKNNVKVEYSKLVIATGSKPLDLFRDKGLKDSIFTFKWFSDAFKLKRFKGEKIVVIGSGLIGIEVAIALAKKGKSVTIIEALPHIMPLSFDKEAADKISEILNKKGIKIIQNDKVLDLLIKNGNLKSVITNKREISADGVVIATGMVPEVSLAKDAGIELGSTKSIKVDSNMRTNIEDIYAAGDCIEIKDFLFDEPRRNLFWYFAKMEGKVAGENCAGIKKEFFPLPQIVSVDIFNTPVFSLGFTEEEMLRMNKKPKIFTNENKKGYLKLIYLDEKLVGVQIINRIKEIPQISFSLLRGTKKQELVIRRDIPFTFLPYSHLRRKLNS